MIASFLAYAAAFWIGCMIWFMLIQKPIFMFYNRKGHEDALHADSILGVYTFGLRSDAIVSSYLTAIPLIIGALATMIPAIPFFWIMRGYIAVIALAMGLLTAGDAALYPFWGFKIDGSVFRYLRSLKGATASVSGAYLATGICAWLFLSLLFYFGITDLCDLSLAITPLPETWLNWWGYPLVVLLMAVGVGLLFLMIRGLGIRPNNPSQAYFSKEAFLNHSALNPGYSIIYSLSLPEKFSSQFRFMPEEKAEEIVTGIFKNDMKAGEKFLKTDRPDILLVIWESFGAEFSEAFGGKKNVAINIDKEAERSVIFTNCTAGSFRTDRGLLCILSGYPAQPTDSIIRYSRKLPNLPGLARTLKEQGYQTEVFHGGDLSIMHKNDYYIACGHDTLRGEQDFPKDAPTCKWGIHDGYMMERVADEIERLSRKSDRKPFMITLQTLSSHEHYEVPYSRLEDKIDNAFAYTDDSFGKMIERLRQTPEWERLLVVVVADHGLNTSHHPADRKSYSHIPLLFTGGAVKGPARYEMVMSQTDLAAILLGQMGIDHSDFIFSRDVLSPDYVDPIAFHIFHNGIMSTDTRGTTIYDTLADTVVSGEDNARIEKCKALLQYLYTDIDKR